MVQVETNQLNLKIPSIGENIRIVESFVDNVNEKFNLTDDVYGNIMVAVTEAVNNAIYHGNKGDAKKNVHISIHLEENELTFKIKDEGEGFDFENLPDPTAPENLEKIGGRGIFLIQHLSDKVEFNENGKEIHMTFKL